MKDLTFIWRGLLLLLLLVLGRLTVPTSRPASHHLAPITWQATNATWLLPQLTPN